jgi:hypothetical protein
MVIQLEPASVEYSNFTFPLKQEEVQVILWEEPACQVSPPLGEVAVITCGAMVKLALLTSEGVPVLASETLTREVVEGVLGITQDSDPSLGVLAIIVIQLEPALVEYSNFTLVMLPVEVQVMLWLLPTHQLSPPLGEVTFIVGTALMVKLASLISEGVPVAASETLTLAWVVGALGIVHGSVPSLAVLATMVFQVEPALVEYSIFTLPLKLVEVQVML